MKLPKTKTKSRTHRFLILNPYASLFAENNEEAGNFYCALERYVESIINSKELQDSIAFLKSSPYRVYNNKRQVPVFEHNRVYYTSERGFIKNSRYKREIWVDECTKVDLAECDTYAVRNLTAVVADFDLSLGDRKIIKDIAIKSWRGMLERVLSTSGGVDGLGVFASLIRTDLHECALHELESYGFHIKSKRFMNLGPIIE